MTTDDDPTAEDSETAGLSLLPEPDMGLRVSQANFARMLGVSRQTVSRWVQDGKVLVDPSGRLDPVKATERVLRHSNPARLRATLLKPVMDDMAGLRTELRDALERAEAAEDLAEHAAARADEAEKDVAMVEAAGDRFIASVAAHLDDLAALGDPVAVRAELDDLYMDALAAACNAQAVDTDERGSRPPAAIDPARDIGISDRAEPVTGDTALAIGEGGRGFPERDLDLTAGTAGGHD